MNSALRPDFKGKPGQAAPENETYGFITDDADRAWDRIRHKRETSAGKINGLSTGFPKLDNLIDGLRDETITMFGARPKQGKSGFLLSIIRNIVRDGKPAVLFSLEMPRSQVTERLIAMEAKVDYLNMVRGLFNDNEADEIANAAYEVGKWPLILDGACGITPSELQRRAERAVKREGAQAIFIDYLQRVRPEKGTAKGKYEEVSAVSVAIADMRKVLKKPVVCAVQLNRKVVDRSTFTDFTKFTAESTRPNDGDLRDSGQLEQDADALCFVNRPVVTLEHLKPADSKDSRMIDWEDKMNTWRPKAEISVHFNRHGPSGFVPFKFFGPQMRFEEVL